jgi:hypothetical protein
MIWLISVGTVGARASDTRISQWMWWSSSIQAQFVAQRPATATRMRVFRQLRVQRPRSCWVGGPCAGSHSEDRRACAFFAHARLAPPAFGRRVEACEFVFDP